VLEKFQNGTRDKKRYRGTHNISRTNDFNWLSSVTADSAVTEIQHSADYGRPME